MFIMKMLILQLCLTYILISSASKYVINRSLHGISHIGPGIIPPASQSGLIWESRVDTRANMENDMY
jgi:hypothetical protein